MSKVTKFKLYILQCGIQRCVSAKVCERQERHSAFGAVGNGNSDAVSRADAERGYVELVDELCGFRVCVCE